MVSLLCITHWPFLLPLLLLFVALKRCRVALFTDSGSWLAVGHQFSYLCPAHKPKTLQVAIKFLERGSGVNKSVLREILNHRLCVVHPNIVQFKEVFLTPNHLAIVMEFAAGGDMFEYVIRNKAQVHGQGLKEGDARGFFQQLLVALEFCHELGIANR